MLKHTWLPAATADSPDALQIVSTKGSHLILDNGQTIYDAISSWWCKPLGHRHDLVYDAIVSQLELFEHHISANAYNTQIEKLSTNLCGIFDTMDKVMYASDGSSAIEIAMKLSYEARLLQGQTHRSKFLALNNAYHGETIFTLSVCGISSYKAMYTPYLCNNHFINNVPYVSGRSDPIWQDCGIDTDELEQFVAEKSHEVTAIIIEPIVQGAAGLKIISRDFLIKLIHLVKKYDVHVISDEIMVGLGRLGCLSVTKDILDYEPEFVCFAKNLTAGSIPMSATVIKSTISDLFRKNNKLFAHSHTHSCNALAASVANSYLEFLTTSPIFQQANDNEADLLKIFNNLADKYPFIENTRAIGSIAACELNLSSEKLTQLFNIDIVNGIYLRPIGNTLYIIPPLYNLQYDLIEIQSKLESTLKQLFNCYRE
jgi:adenosylmethionine---8-amino-7-oxononanoate aminotransferase